MRNVEKPIPIKSGLVLIGYRATGKTTIGRMLAHHFGLPFVDLDHEVEAATKRSIAEIFRMDGESAFRQSEMTTLRRICEEPPGSVLSTGGGTVLIPKNRELLKSYGLVIWLSAPVDTIVARLEKSPNSRPALTAAGLLAEVEDVMRVREPLYSQIADLVIDASPDSPSHVVSNVLAQLDDKWTPRR